MAALITVPALCIVGLLVMVVYLGFRENGLPSGAWTLSNYRILFGDNEIWGVLRNTIVYGAVTIAVATLSGLAMAWLVERTDFGWRRAINTAMVVRILIPGFFTAMGWLFLFHPRIGAVNRWLMELLGLTSAPVDATSLVWMGFVEGLVLSAVVFVLASTSLRSMDAALEETARANGASAWPVFRCITLPLTYPALAGAGIFVAMIAVSSLDVPLVLGLGDNVYVFSTYVYVQSRPTDGVAAYGVAAAFSSVIVLLALVVTWWYTRLLSRSRNYQVVTGKGYRPQPVRLGRWRGIAWLFVGGYFLWSTILPLLIVFWVSTQPFVQVPSRAALELASWDNYRQLDWGLVLRGLETTGKLMLLAPTLAVLISLGFSWVAVRSRLRARRVYDIVAFMPHAVPQLIFAFSAVLLALYWSRGWYDVYGSLVLLVAVVALVQVAFGTRMVNAGLIQLHTELDEAAAVSGASAWTVLRRIILPLMKPAMIYAWVWLALLAFRDLTIPALVGSRETLTLSVVVWALFNTNNVGQASAVTIVMLLLFVPLVALFLLVDRERRVERAGSGMRA